MVEYAAISKRFLAMILDGMIFFVLCVGASHIVPILGGAIMFFFYAPVLESSEVQATVGKYLVGIEVTDLQRHRLSYRTALIRNFMKIVSSCLFFLGYFIVLFTDRRQALHDLVAETIVVPASNRSISVFDAWMNQIKNLFQKNVQLGSEPSRTLSDLERLHSLREKGVLTEEEFQREKERILKKNE